MFTSVLYIIYLHELQNSVRHLVFCDLLILYFCRFYSLIVPSKTYAIYVAGSRLFAYI